MALHAPKKRLIVSGRHSGEPKGRKVSPQLFQGLELWPYVRYLISLPQIPPSGLVPLTEVSIHPDAFTLSQATQSRPVFVPHNPCTSFKDACYLQTFGVEKLEGHTSDQEKTRSPPVFNNSKKRLGAEMEAFLPAFSAPEWSLLRTWLRKHGQRTLGASCPPGPPIYPIDTDQTHIGKWKPPLSFCLYELLTGAIWTDWISPWKCWYFHDLKSLAQLE